MKAGRFSIRQRLMALALGTLLAVCAVASVGVAAVLDGTAVAEDFAGRDLAALNQTAVLRDSLSRMARQEMELVVNFESAPLVDAARVSWEKSWATAREVAQRLASDQDPAVAEDAARVQHALVDYRGGVQRFLTQLETGAVLSAAVGNELMAPGRAGLRLADEWVSKLAERVSLRVDKSRSGQLERSWWMIGMLVAAAVIGCLAVAALAAFTFRAIHRPLKLAQAAADRAAQGDLTASALVHRPPGEMAALLRSLSQMQQGLASLVHGVREGAAGIDLATAELAAGNSDLSQRTENEAMELDAAAAAAESLRMASDASASNARKAAGQARSAADAAEAGMGTMSELATGMRFIQDSAERIADIVGVINGIAFQTNLLALNAAVEAARAGSQGRGFAVVAQEVRGLAQKCAESAQEIRQVVASACERVQAGARLAEAAGVSMSGLRKAVREVASVLDEVSGTTQSQHMHVEELLGGIHRLHDTTQQNAALVEQSAAASEALRQQTRAMERLVGTFIVPDRPAVSLLRVTG